MKIREATKKDITILKNLFYDSMKEINQFYDDNGGIDLKNVKNYLKKSVNFGKIFKQRKWFLAEADGKIIGFADGKIEKKNSFFRERKAGRIHHLFIEKGYRNKEIGTELVKTLVSWFRKNKIKTIELDVSPRNRTAIKLYERMGFKEFDIQMRKKI